MAEWRKAIHEGVRSGTAASVLSTVVLVAAGRLQSRHAAAPTNATSQWIWGAEALHASAPSWRHTATGYAIHHGAAIFWATLYARASAGSPRAATPAGALAGGLAAAAVACFADYRLTPRRFTPGFEHRLSRGAMAWVYVAFGVGIAVASLACRREAARAGRGDARGRAGLSRLPGHTAGDRLRR